MSTINYEKLLIETGLAAAVTSANQFPQNFGAMSYDFGGFVNGLGAVQHRENAKLKCSTKTVSYSTFHVSTTTKA